MLVQHYLRASQYGAMAWDGRLEWRIDDDLQCSAPTFRTGGIEIRRGESHQIPQCRNPARQGRRAKSSPRVAASACQIDVKGAPLDLHIARYADDLIRLQSGTVFYATEIRLDVLLHRFGNLRIVNVLHRLLRAIRKKTHQRPIDGVAGIDPQTRIPGAQGRIAADVDPSASGY